jgi:hypothetical protein
VLEKFEESQLSQGSFGEDLMFEGFIDLFNCYQILSFSFCFFVLLTATVQAQL